MPNYCYNYVALSGDLTEILKKLSPHFLIENGQWTRIKEENADPCILHVLYPYPDEDGAGDWARSKWGSKWGYCDPDYLDICDKEIAFTSSTAWGPPIEGLKYIAKKYNIRIETTYEESGMNFCGCFIQKGDEELQNFVAELYVTTLDNPDKAITEKQFNEHAHMMRVGKDLEGWKPIDLIDDVEDEMTLEDFSYEEYLDLIRGGKVPLNELKLTEDGKIVTNLPINSLTIRKGIIQNDSYRNWIAVHANRADSILIKECFYDPEVQDDYLVINGKIVYFSELPQVIVVTECEQGSYNLKREIYSYGVLQAEDRLREVGSGRYA